MRGERHLNMLVSAFEVVIDQLLINATELHGHIAAIKNVDVPKRSAHIHEDSDDS